MNLRELYRTFGDDSEAGALSRQLLDQHHWFASIAEFDPKTGDAMPVALDTVLHRMADRGETTNIRDRLWRILEHCRASVERVFGSLSENPRREQAILPIRAVKELNATSFIALSRRPGRNVREKLAGKPYMQAVRRYQSVDLPQNQLVKEFVTQLAELLEFRRKYVGHEDELLDSISHWLRSDQARAISRWDNLPPNNTLLSHRDYRRIWDAWRWLQVLDNAVDSDIRQLNARAAVVEKWQGYGKAYSDGTTLFGDMPVLFDYDAFTITPWRKPIFRANPAADRAVVKSRPVVGPVCVDLTYLRPRYAASGSTAASTLPEAFIWQRWQNDHESVDLELFDADIVLLDPESTSVSSADLFFVRDTAEPLLDWAAHAFSRKLSKTFTDSVLVWLVPDFLSDFQLQVARRNINARFSKAEPLPRSVAAVFEQIDYLKIKNDGFQALVVDAVGGISYATKLIARHDPDLQKRVPETRGFFWERLPHVTIEHNEAAHTALNEIPYIDGDGCWHDALSAQKLQPIDQNALRSSPQIGEFDICITLPDSPVSGGIRLHELQQRAGDIPLWRDHIPELSIKVIKDRRYQPFYLVDRVTTIRPIRGMPVRIPVNDLFTLPAGKHFYEFPLFQGQDPDDLGYVAKLESSSFPLRADVTCRLAMTYTYGADDPYRLVFNPLDRSFKPVQAHWQPKTDQVVTNAPAPEYPQPATWREMQEHFNVEKGVTTNYPDWAARKTSDLLDNLSPLAQIFHGTIKTEWKTNPKGGRFTFAQRDDEKDIYINETALAGRVPHTTFSEGDDVYFLVEQRSGRSESRYVAKSTRSLTDAVAKDLTEFIRRALYVPYIKTWADGRSLGDAECPIPFQALMVEHSQKLLQALQSPSTPNAVQTEILFLLCCMHKDMPDFASQRLTSGAESQLIDEKLLGFALGDLSQAWQQDIFRRLLSKINPQTLGVFARAIWRNEGFIQAFSFAELSEVAHLTLRAIQDVNDKPSPSRSDDASLTRYCELLLGLLRSRSSEDPEVRTLLQPHQSLTREFAEQIERTVTFFAQASAPFGSRVPTLESRVQVASLPEKPEGESTPDLLYALRLYLTGDVGANAIRVTGVNEGEDD